MLYLRVLSGSPVILRSSSRDLGVERAVLINCKALSFAGHTNPLVVLIIYDGNL